MLRGSTSMTAGPTMIPSTCHADGLAPAEAPCAPRPCTRFQTRHARFLQRTSAYGLKQSHDIGTLHAIGSHAGGFDPVWINALKVPKLADDPVVRALVGTRSDSKNCDREEKLDFSEGSQRDHQRGPLQKLQSHTSDNQK
jgi:hypothetical protein